MQSQAELGPRAETPGNIKMQNPFKNKSSVHCAVSATPPGHLPEVRCHSSVPPLLATFLLPEPPRAPGVRSEHCRGCRFFPSLQSRRRRCLR